MLALVTKEGGGKGGKLLPAEVCETAAVLWEYGCTSDKDEPVSTNTAHQEQSSQIHIRDRRNNINLLCMRVPAHW